MMAHTALGRRARREVLPPRRKARSVLSRILGEAVLWGAALLGALCIVLVLLAVTMNITLIMFRTGSMAPTIPAGSVAIVQRVPAADIAVGDVVTVDRSGELPVTHRVTSVSAGSLDGTRMITMRGDANAVDDPAPYEVSSVRMVLFSIPGIAHAIAALGDPLLLGGLTIAASLLVGWAFWPRKPRTKEQGTIGPDP